MIPSAADFNDARERIRGTAIRTPLVRLNGVDGEVWLKLENLQPIGSFKIRGAANAMARLSPEQLARGVFTASAGNMAQGAAWCARKLGVPCTVISPDTAPRTKIEAVERLGGRVILAPFHDWWRTFETRSFPGIEATFLHAFDDLDVMAGNGTIGLEILEDLPGVDSVLIPWGGGGLSCGIAAAMRAMKSRARIYAAEVATSAPLSRSLQSGSPQVVEHAPSFVDGIGAKTVFPAMFERAKSLLDGTVSATLDEIRAAIRWLAARNRLIAEGAGAVPVACAMAGNANLGKVVCVVSGGNIDLDKLREILTD